jgi:hypothetical protein
MSTETADEYRTRHEARISRQMWEVRPPTEDEQAELEAEGQRMEKVILGMDESLEDELVNEECVVEVLTGEAGLIVFKSVIVRDTDAIYKPVVDHIAQNDLVLADQAFTKSGTLMYGQMWTGIYKPRAAVEAVA